MKKNLYFSVLISILALSAQAQCTFGNFPPLYTANPGWTNGMWLAKKINVTTGAVINGLGLNAGAQGGVTPYCMALYTDASGVPGNFVAATGAATMVAGINVMPVTTATTITSGTYWIMAIYNNSGVSTTYSQVPTAPAIFGLISSFNALPPNNSGSWFSGSNYDIDYFAVINSPTLSISGPTAVCAGSPASFTVSGASTYTWSNGTVNPVSTYTPQSGNNYSVVAINSMGCAGFKTFSIAVNPLPVVSISGNNHVCMGSSTTLTVSASGASSNTVVATPASSGQFTASLTNNNGCTNTASISLIVDPLPVLSIAGNTAGCVGSLLTQSISGAASYSWSTGSAASSISLTLSGNTVITATGTGTNGCVSVITESVTAYALPSVSITSDKTTICAGETVSLTASGAITWLWNNSATTPVISVSPSLTTSYSVTGTDAHGCANTATITQLVSICTGIAQEAQSAGFSAWPNPGNGLLTVHVIDPNTEAIIEVYAMSGARVKSEKLSSHEIQLDLRNLDSGLYYLVLNSGSQRSVMKLIKE